MARWILLFAFFLAGRSMPALQSQEPEIPAILKRLPSELPRDEDGRWKTYAEGSELAKYGISRETAQRILGLREDYLAKRYPRVIEGLFAILQEDPDLPEALSVLGLTYFRLRRYGDAAYVYERLLEAVPRLRERTLALGHCYYSLGDYERARDHYLALRALRPQEGAIQRGLALTRFRLGQEDEALRLFEDLLKREIEVSESHYWIGRIHYDAGDPEEAFSHAQVLIELQPFDNRAWYLWMQVLYDLGKEEKAQAAEVRWREIDRATQELRKIDASLAMQPERFDLLLRRVEVNRGLGDLAAVRASVPSMLRVVPKNVDPVPLHTFAIDVLMGMGDREGALWVAGVMEKRFADDVRVWEKLGVLYGSLRLRTEQINASRRARELKGEDG